MSWARFDESYCVHPKVVRAGNAAVGVHARSVTWSNMHATDGFVPREILANMFGDGDEQLAAKLVEVGLFHRAEGGYTIHDFLDYNPSAKHVKREREKARKRMQNVRANGSGRSGNVRTNNPEPSEGCYGHVPGRVGTGSLALPEAAKNLGAVARARGRKRPSVPLPKGFALDAELTEVLREAGCRNPTQGFAAFVAYHRREGSVFVDWRAAVRTWAGNHERFGCPCQGPMRRNGHGAEPHYPDLSAEIAADRARDRAQQAKASA